MRACVCVCVCVCVSVCLSVSVSVSIVSVIVKRPVLPPCAVDRRSRNPLYYYYHTLFHFSRRMRGLCVWPCFVFQFF